MTSLTLEPISHVSGTIHLPGSKSISNRALLLAALSEGETELSNLLVSDDVSHMLEALKQLGVNYSLSDGGTFCKVAGRGAAFSTDGLVELFLGNAGTAMRPLAAALALSPVDVRLTGEPRMEERPIGHLLDALRQLGADVSCEKNEGYPPLRIQGKALEGGRVTIDGSVSSQFLTAMLMAAPLVTGEVVIEIKGDLVSKPYIDITLALMKSFGVEVVNDHYKSFKIPAGQTYRSPGQFLVEGDASSASYFLAAAAIRGGEVTVTGIGENSLQGDTAFAQVLADMGAQVTMAADHIKVSRHGRLRGIDQDMNRIPDAAMTIATTALFADGPTTIRNIANWRVKETDRLAAMAAELRKVGATVDEGEDYLTIEPPTQLRHAEIETYNDHRIAMCFSLVALSDTPVTILDPGCTSKTFPTYFDEFARISER
ncbi:3-phosphoshikimate 1-carboxyvinyltransferase [Haloferula chungangensis]|uniref:3-phosphoshikimate 1-carboxyvinyltransferase n=1 Tax=Haloferula chungangensis TaxID=1048331 RepID=A0ABW2L4P8_9BACT